MRGLAKRAGSGSSLFRTAEPRKACVQHSGCGEALREIRTDLGYSLRLSQRSGDHHATAATLTRSGVDGSLAKGGHGLVEVRLRLKSCQYGSSISYCIVLDRLEQQGGLVSEGSV